jgi:hypothetical protein
MRSFYAVLVSRILMIGLSVIVSACASLDGYPKRIGDSEQYVAEVSAFVSPTAILDYNAAVNPAQNNSPSQLIIIRNNIVTARLYAIDVNYHNFVHALTSEQNVGSVGTDWVALALAGFGATTGSAATKAALAAASGGVIGARAAVSKDVFYNNTVPTLITQMEAQRKLVLALIYSGLQKSTADYTIYQALADLDAYYNAGTLNGALVGLSNSASANSQFGDGQIAASLTLHYSFDTPAQSLRKFWMPDGTTVNAQNAAAIRSWMSTNKLNTASIPAFIYGKEYASQRAKAVKDLNLP